MNPRDQIMMMAAAIAANMAEQMALPMSTETVDLIANESVRLAFAIESVTPKLTATKPEPRSIPK